MHSTLEKKQSQTSQPNINAQYARKQTSSFISAGIGALVIRAHMRYGKWGMRAATTISAQYAREETSPFISAGISAQDAREETSPFIAVYNEGFAKFNEAEERTAATGSGHGSVGAETRHRVRSRSPSRGSSSE